MSDGPKTTRRRRPVQWRQVNFPTRGIYRLNPNPRRPMRRRAFEIWDSARFVIRSSSLWAVIAGAAFAVESYILSALSAFLSFAFFLFRPHRKPLALRLDEDFGTDSAEFLSTMAGATGVPLTGGNRIKLYSNGDEFYPAMLAAIAKAQYSVTMEQYMFSDGEIGRRFVEAFAERARAGVSVKLLVDAVGSSSLSSDMIRVLKESGCELAWFHPIRWYNLHRVNNRTHRKSVIIDGRIAFTGGAGIDDHWLGRARNPSEWRDLQIKIDGPGVTPLQTGFSVNWLDTTGEVITGPRYYPVPHSRGNVEVQCVVSSPRGDSYTATILYQLAIFCARQSIYITNPYFVPSEQVIDLLADAVERGVEVKVILAGVHNDNWWARHNSVRLYGKLLAAGVEIYEFEPTMLHQKTMIVDHIWATVGTTNFDDRSFRLNEESNVCFYEPRLVGRLREIFFEDLGRSSKVEIGVWLGRGPWKQMGERVASLLKDQV